ncbi:MAG: hypothetical protein UX31_C0039G0018 [Candidatus Nomurabacteria bacterium GW2011_GWA1_46_11]|uniref:Uncharacterized protein n=1 Tax=Candidatus Nomurabacteria bacterium GW2011_GWA1_46_11 TaxID=1618732 RepID=A0A0G1QRT6_9BACT|nr:MAG: hypothetical protein UX31_C0039G0018 [Candidatus Nomurabacteria bacterium GW2011_GWA1_46_11]
MKTKILVPALLVAIFIPQIVLAAWWNPFSWKVFTRIFTLKEEIVQTTTTTGNGGSFY